eukprot:4461639-Amphidinium_carterae.1
MHKTCLKNRWFDTGSEGFRVLSRRVWRTRCKASEFSEGIGNEMIHELLPMNYNNPPNDLLQPSLKRKPPSELQLTRDEGFGT